jgi:hypothetical protein
VAMRVPSGRKRAKPVLSSDSEIELVEHKRDAAANNDGGRGGPKKAAAAPIYLSTGSGSDDADAPLLPSSSAKKLPYDADGADKCRLQIPRDAQGECGGDLQ